MHQTFFNHIFIRYRLINPSHKPHEDSYSPKDLVKIRNYMIIVELNYIFIWFSWRLTVVYNDVIMGAIASQMTSLMIVYSIVYSDADQRKHQSSASLAFVRGIHRWPVNSPHKWPVTRKMFPFDDVINGYFDDICYAYIWVPVCQKLGIKSRDK